MRVTNSMIYNNSLQNMQSSLGALLESNIQGGSQKQINRPSDDPAGAALVLNSRVDIAATEQFERNVDTAYGWLQLADSTLQSVSTTIAEIKSLTEQAASETMTAENREQISFQIEELFGQLLNLSNMEFEGKSIFAGQKYDDNAYEQGLSVISKDGTFDTSTVTVSGDSENTMAVRFTSSGTVGVDALTYQWSDNGGDTWNDATMNAGETSLTMDGVTLDIRPGSTVQGATRTDNIYSDDGTFLYVHPTAVYQGDDNDRNIYGVTTGAPEGLGTTVVGSLTDNVIFTLGADVDLTVPGSAINYSVTYSDGTVQNYTSTVPNPPPPQVPDGKVELPFEDINGDRLTIELDTSNATTSALTAGMQIDLQPRRVDVLSGVSTDISINTQGVFSSNTLVRLDTDADLNAAGSIINYSYSSDGGQTWIAATSQVPTPATGSTRLALPGGFMELSNSPTAAAPGPIAAGTQMLIHPDRADLGYEIMEDTYVAVNQVGKDIFGGQYNGQTVAGPNLFEVVGQLISYCEYNDSDGIAATLETLTAAHEHVETEATRIGGLNNRLDLAANMLSFQKLDQQERLSYTEDIDLTELLNNLAKQELTYNTVLKSSSMIMQLNLTQFV